MESRNHHPPPPTADFWFENVFRKWLLLCVVQSVVSCAVCCPGQMCVADIVFKHFLLFVDDVLRVFVMVDAMFLGGRIVSIFVVFLDQIRGRSHRMRQRDASGRRSPRLQVQIIFESVQITCIVTYFIGFPTNN
jgi:hypothetical protein